MTPSRGSSSNAAQPEGLSVPAKLRVLPGDEGTAADVRVHVNTFKGVRLVIDTGNAFWLVDVEPAVAAYLAGHLAAAGGVVIE